MDAAPSLDHALTRRTLGPGLLRKRLSRGAPWPQERVHTTRMTGDAA